MRVGVLANPMLLRWQEEALSAVAELSGVRIEHVVVDATVREEDSTLRAGSEVINQGRTVTLADVGLFLDVLREQGLKAFIHADQKLGWLAFDESAQLDALQSRDVAEADCLADATFHDCHPVSAGGAWNTLPDDVTGTLGTGCDVVIRFGFGLLRGPILRAPAHGVLSTHGSDIRSHRGMGPKISFYRGDDDVCVTLQQLSEEIDGGRIVKLSSKSLPEHHTLDDVLGATYELQRDIYAAGIERLRDGSFTPWAPEELGPYYGHDTQERRFGFVAGLLLKNNWRRLRKTVAEHR